MTGLAATSAGKSAGTDVRACGGRWVMLMAVAVVHRVGVLLRPRLVALELATRCVGARDTGTGRGDVGLAMVLVVVLLVAAAVCRCASGCAQTLAKRLEEQGATMFGAYWCGHCYAQKQLFGADAFARIRYIECARDGVGSQAALCREKKVPVRSRSRGQPWAAALSLSIQR